MLLMMRLAIAFAAVVLVAAPIHAQVKWKHGLVQAKGDAGFFWMAKKQA